MYMSCGQAEQPVRRGLNLPLGHPGAQSRTDFLAQQGTAPGETLVRVARPARRAVPRRGRAVHQPLLLAAPGPRLGQRVRPQADVERPDARPDEPHLLLAGTDDLLALAEG